MQQSKLSFACVTADDAATQRAHIAALHAREHPAAAAASAEKRRPGRPKKRPLELLPAAAEAAPAAAQPAAKRAHTNWFSSPYIRDILQAYEQHGRSAKRTVAALKRHAPDERYQHLSDSTLRSWMDPATQHLLPRFAEQLVAGKADPTSQGRPAPLSPAAEQKAKEALLALRDTGTPLSSNIIRWTLQAVFRQLDPSLLDSLSLSQQWISLWVREKLDWRWRARTTAASKLPHDWEVQGITMAKRVAAAMEMHGVRKTDCHTFSPSLS
jgi:hypothetical protein